MAETQESGLDLDGIRERLLAQRQEITDMYRSDVQAGKNAQDEQTDDIVDRANNSYNRELMFSLSDNERGMLLLLDKALARLEDGTYGSCTNCGREIGEPRLEAVPWAGFCIQCQELSEQGLLEPQD